MLKCLIIPLLCDVTCKDKKGLYFRANPFSKSEVGPTFGSLIKVLDQGSFVLLPRGAI